MAIQINKIYSAISGEVGTVIPQGTPCLIVRTQGCNLRCRDCDACETQAMGVGFEFSVDKLVQVVQEYGLPVLLTGGEPLIQPEIFEFIERVDSTGTRLQIETNGTISVSEICDSPFLSVIMDVKPGSENRVSELGINDWAKFMVHSIEGIQDVVNQIDSLVANGAMCKFAISHILGEGESYSDLDLDKYSFTASRGRGLVTLNFQLHKLLNLP